MSLFQKDLTAQAPKMPPRIYGLYVIRDLETLDNGDPLCLPDDTVAKRTMVIGMKDGRLQMQHFPESFDMVKIGTFNRATCEVVAYPPAKIEQIITGRAAYDLAHGGNNVRA